MMNRLAQQRSLVALTLGVAAALVSGCGTGAGGGNGSAPIVAAAGRQLSGQVYGGRQPISDATIQLYAVNLSARQGLSSALLDPAPTTDANGNFSITQSFTCPTGGFVYLTASGGDAGSGTNLAITQMAGLGPCSGLTGKVTVHINELTTAATVYALAPYMADAAHVGAAASNLTGITNAFLMINSLVTIATGASPGVAAPAGAAIPTTTLNSIADILAACVNSNGAGPACVQLFEYALPVAGGPQPTTTLGAVLNMADNPSLNVAQIFTVMGSQPPFTPYLMTAPNDWTVAINLTGSALSSPYGVAIDGSGNAWVTNESGYSVTEFSALGAALSGANGFGYPNLLGPQGLSIDGSGNVWVANTGGNSVMKFAASGSLASPTTGYTTASIVAPVDVAVDARGNVWVADFLGGAVTELNSSGTLVGSGGLTAGGTMVRPDAVAIDLSGDVWVSNSGAGTLTEFSKSAALLSTGNGYTDNALQAPAGLALDAAGRAWVGGAGGNELSGFTSAGASLATTPVYGFVKQPAGVAVDGAGTVWVASGSQTGGLYNFTAGTGVPLCAASGLGALSAPAEIAVDGSGNVWTANSGDSSVSIFVGLAAPAVTPLVARTQ